MSREEKILLSSVTDTVYIVRRKGTGTFVVRTVGKGNAAWFRMSKDIRRAQTFPTQSNARGTVRSFIRMGMFPEGTTIKDFDIVEVVSTMRLSVVTQRRKEASHGLRS